MTTTSTWWCNPLPCTRGRPKWLVDSSSVSSLGYFLGTFFLIFCFCCPLRGHRWTPFSFVSDRLLSYLSTNLPHLTSPSMFTNYFSISKYHALGRVKMACQFPEGLILGRFSLDNSSRFYRCCPMRGHISTAFLNPIDCTPSSSTFFLTTPLSPFFHLKPFLYLLHSPLSLILMLLLISGDIHPNPGPIDTCFIFSRRVTWGNRSVQCTNCSLWVHLSCSGLFPADFRKISPGHSWTCPMFPSSSQLPPSLLHPNPVPSFINTPNPPSLLINTHKTISSKINPHLKTTTNLLDHPRLLHYLNHYLNRVSSFKTVRPHAPCVVRRIDTTWIISVKERDPICAWTNGIAQHQSAGG